MRAGPNPGWPRAKGHHPLLHERGRGVRHPRAPALPRPQDLRAEALELGLPPVVRGVVDPHGPASRSHAPELPGEGEHSQPERVQGIIGGQGGASFPLDVVVKRQDASPSTWGVGPPPVSLQLGDTTP